MRRSDGEAVRRYGGPTVRRSDGTAVRRYGGPTVRLSRQGTALGLSDHFPVRTIGARAAVWRCYVEVGPGPGGQAQVIAPFEGCAADAVELAH